MQVTARCFSILLLLAGVVISGCASSVPDAINQPLLDEQGEPQFPSQASLDAVRAQKPPVLTLSMRSRLVDSWTLVGPLPDRLATTPITQVEVASGDPWLVALAALARDRGNMTLTREMECAARETVRFVSMHEARPATELLNFMASRCGSLAVDVTTSFITREDFSKMSDAEVLDEWRPLLQQLLPREHDTARARRYVAGIGFHRGHGRISVALTLGEVKVALSHADAAPDDRGRVILRGRLLGPVVAARALITRGMFDATSCSLHSRVELPEFRLTSDLDRADRSVWLEMVRFRPDRPVGSSAMRLLLWPSGQPSARYYRTSYHPPRPAIAEPDLGAGLTALVNAIRTRAGREPLLPAVAQTEVARSLTPYYFDAIFDPAKQALGDTIALGLMAGWKVPETVDRSWFGASVTGDGDLSAVVSSMLASPFGRETLMGERAHYLAVGTFAQTDSIGAMFSAYSVAHHRDREHARAHVLAALTAQRQAVGHSVPRPMGYVQDVADQAADQIQRGTPVADVLSALLTEVTARARKQARAWLISAPSLTEVTLPEPVIEMSDAVVAVGVAIWRKPGAARPHYTIIIAAYPR